MGSIDFIPEGYTSYHARRNGQDKEILRKIHIYPNKLSEEEKQKKRAQYAINYYRSNRDTLAAKRSIRYMIKKGLKSSKADILLIQPHISNEEWQEIRLEYLHYKVNKDSKKAEE